MYPSATISVISLILLAFLNLIFAEPIRVINGCLGPFSPPPIGTKFIYRLLTDHKNGHAKHDVSIEIQPTSQNVLTRSWIVDICFVDKQCITAVWDHDVELLRLTNQCWRIYSNPNARPLHFGDMLDLTFLTYRSDSIEPSIPAFLVMLGNQVKLELRSNLPSSAPQEFCSDCDGGYSPLESNCTKYVRCVNGSPITQICPLGTLFNPRKQVCDWPSSAGCGNTPTLIRRTCNVATCIEPYIHFAFISACVAPRIGLFA